MGAGVSWNHTHVLFMFIRLDAVRLQLLTYNRGLFSLTHSHIKIQRHILESWKCVQLTEEKKSLFSEGRKTSYWKVSDVEISGGGSEDHLNMAVIFVLLIMDQQAEIYRVFICVQFSRMSSFLKFYIWTIQK
jgi:hypothetical protein